MKQYINKCIRELQGFHQDYLNYLSYNGLKTPIIIAHVYDIFSSAVPSGSGAFQMQTRPSASAASTLRGEGPISETLQ